MGASFAPFAARRLGDGNSETDLNALLPAASHTKQGSIVIPTLDDVDFFERELLVSDLESIRDLFWLCGRPTPPRPLHHQVLLSREIRITERPELHLVWDRERIFIKPMPRWLLDKDFWDDVLMPSDEDSADRKSRKGRLTESACGFLFTYSALISYESDFNIAMDKHLLPRGMKWDRWRELSANIVQNHSYSAVSPRYLYGELRLSRLNKIYRIKKGSLLRGFSQVASHSHYKDLIRDNFASLGLIFGYVVIVLTAMQVGLGTNRLVESNVFQDVSYGFTVFSIIAPLIASAGIMALVLAMFINNWQASKAYERKRFREMNIKAFSRA